MDETSDSSWGCVKFAAWGVDCAKAGVTNVVLTSNVPVAKATANAAEAAERANVCMEVLNCVDLGQGFDRLIDFTEHCVGVR